jgi:hypothetical protein
MFEKETSYFYCSSDHCCHIEDFAVLISEFYVENVVQKCLYGWYRIAEDN